MLARFQRQGPDIRGGRDISEFAYRYSSFLIAAALRPSLLEAKPPLPN